MMSARSTILFATLLVAHAPATSGSDRIPDPASRIPSSSADGTTGDLNVATVPDAESSLGVLAPQLLWETWPDARFVDTPAPCLEPDELADQVSRLANDHRDSLRVERAGESLLGRPIFLLTVGYGPRKVLLWSQMHGDEPSATPALLDLADFLLSHSEQPGIRRILEELTLLMVPMLNPDGAQRYTRRTSQGIDMNRDALALSTPEGRLLKSLRDEHQPVLGFNLHDQNRRRTVGTTPVLASISVLAVTGDQERTWTPQRLLAKRASAAIADAVESIFPGGVGRFDDSFSPRAFGDNITAWGTPVVLIESGGVPPGHPFEDLTRLNFVALASVLGRLADDDLASQDPDRYDSIGDNELDTFVDVLVRGGRVWHPDAARALPADVAFDLLASDQQRAACSAGPPPRGRIVDVGDGRFLAPARTVEAAGKVLLAPFVVGVEGWGARRWLGASELDRLGELGIGAIEWRVPARRSAAARQIARGLAAVGRTRLEVVDTLGPDLLRLERPLPVLAEPTVGAVVHAIAEASQSPRQPFVDLLPRLWQREVGEPALAPGAPASLVLVDAPEGADLETGHLDAVWLDGHRLGERP